MIFCYKLLECESNNFLVKTKSNAFLVKTDLEGGSKSSISEKWIDNKAIDFKNTKWLSKLYKTEYLFSNGLYLKEKRQLMMFQTPAVELGKLILVRRGKWTFLAGAKPSYTARGDASGKDKGHY